MFLSHEKSPSKMKFQKPNILRKQSKVPVCKGNVCDVVDSVSPCGFQPAASVKALNWPIIPMHKCSKPAHLVVKSIQRTKDDISVQEQAEVNTQTVDENQTAYSKIARSLFSLLNSNEDHNDFIPIQSCSGFNFEDLQTFDVKVMALKDVDDGPDSRAQRPESYIQNPVGQALPAESNLVSNNLLVVEEGNQLLAEASEQTNTCILEVLPTTVTFVCDEPNCNKEFPSEKKLKKHKSVHKKNGGAKNNKQVIECPAYKMCSESWEEKTTCGQQFDSRADLLKHLKGEHTLEDAAFRCDDCRRPFFWSSGVRNHSRACVASGAARRLVCPWAGCGRVFHQPCRLKEHERAHTGDKPYPCRHPNCTWSFRTASKLVRHARRHTGERRHRCGQCGRAFLRPEHLREHLARHRQPAARRRQTKAEQTSEADTSFPKVDVPFGLQMDPLVKTVEAKPETPEPIISTLSLQESAAMKTDSDWSDAEDMFLCVGAMAEGRSARTHCPWPLPRQPPAALPPPDEPVYEVELSEGSESKIYTVRSDLFLHGNMIHNEDSESGVAVIAQTAEEASNGGTLQGTPLDSELGLLDAHSTIDLMQEELMYTDAAVDGSSFQLLGDGDLHTYYTQPVGGVRLNST